ncbi:MAG: transporter substrate-binding domain-containing protein [Thermoplasmata archaeon]
MKRYKRSGKFDFIHSFSIVFICATFFFLSITPMFSLNTADDHNDGITVRVGIYQQPPFMFEDDHGGQLGIYADILVEIAILESMLSDQSWSLQYVPGTYDETLTRLKNDDIDMMVPAPYKTDNDDIVFSNTTIVVGWGTVYTQPDRDIETFLDLEGMKVGVKEYDIHVEGNNGIKNMVSEFNVNCTFVEYPDYQSVFEAIFTGEVDSGVADKTFGQYVRNDFEVQKTSMIFNYVDYRFAYSQNNTHLRETIDTYMRDMKEDPESMYYIAIDKYLGERTETEQETLEVIPRWMINIMLLSAGALAVLGTIIIILDKQVKERTKELKEVNNTLEDDIVKRREAEERVSFLLTLLRHDLKNKHQILQGYLELLTESELSEKDIGMVNKVLNASKDSKQLLDKVGLLGDIEKEEEVRPVNLNEYISRAISKNKLKMDEKDIEVRYEPVKITVMGGFLLEEMFFNLIENAVNHAGCEVIKISAREDDETVVVTVEDDGKGIPKDSWNKVFDKSYKGKGSKGMGIGTYLIKEIAETYGGKIELKDSDMGGARFDIVMKSGDL